MNFLSFSCLFIFKPLHCSFRIQLSPINYTAVVSCTWKFTDFSSTFCAYDCVDRFSFDTIKYLFVLPVLNPAVTTTLIYTIHYTLYTIHYTLYSKHWTGGVIHVSWLKHWAGTAACLFWPSQASRADEKESLLMVIIM